MVTLADVKLRMMMSETTYDVVLGELIDINYQECKDYTNNNTSTPLTLLDNVALNLVIYDFNTLGYEYTTSIKDGNYTRNNISRDSILKKLDRYRIPNLNV